MTLNLILNDLDELGARIDAIASLGAGIAAALTAETIAPDDVYHMLATYAGGLLALQKTVRNRVAVASTRAAGRDAEPRAAGALPNATDAPARGPLDRGLGDGERQRRHTRHPRHTQGTEVTPGR